MATRTNSPWPRLLGLACLLAVLAWLPGTARADWRIDSRVFLASAHGDMSCLDCHADVEDAVHPNADRVNREATSFFTKGECYDCHPDVEDDLAQGRHAKFKALDPQRFETCIACHNPHAVGAPETVEQGAAGELYESDRACMACHAANPSGNDAPADGAAASRKLCFSCHGEGVALPLTSVSEARFPDTPHGGMDCTACHQGADRYPHNAQTLAPCLSCHQRHTEAEIGDAHQGVTCQACHLKGVVPQRVQGSTTVLAEVQNGTDLVADLHDMALAPGEGCVRCHRPGNDVGAADVALPAKSVLCTVCHTATFTVQDGVSFLGVMGLLAGLSMLVAAFSACAAGDGLGERLASLARSCAKDAAGLFKVRVAKAVLLAVIWDVLLQRRLYRRDRTRWLIHACIFWPFAVRCLWGLAALLGTIFLPGQDWVWQMVDKNAPLTALVFDLSGLVLLAGIAAAWVRGWAADVRRLDGTPAQDKKLLGLIGALVLAGFVLEGLRIALTGTPAGSGYAFAGYALSVCFEQSFAQAAYAWGWYAHAALTAACFVYLPFSRLSHVIIAPVVLALKAADAHGHGHDHGHS